MIFFVILFIHSLFLPSPLLAMIATKLSEYKLRYNVPMEDGQSCEIVKDGTTVKKFSIGIFDPEKKLINHELLPLDAHNLKELFPLGGIKISRHNHVFFILAREQERDDTLVIVRRFNNPPIIRVGQITFYPQYKQPDGTVAQVNIDYVERVCVGSNPFHDLQMTLFLSVGIYLLKWDIEARLRSMVLKKSQLRTDDTTVITRPRITLLQEEHVTDDQIVFRKRRWH